MAVVAGIVVGCFLTWNVSNVGAVADPLAATYGVSLAAIGLLTTALFVTHLAAQLPAGIWSDRYGARASRSAACVAAAPGTLVLLQSDEFAVGLVGRLVVGVGIRRGVRRRARPRPRRTVAARCSRASTAAATMAGGGLALDDPAGADRGDELARAVLDRARPRAGCRAAASYARGGPPAGRRAPHAAFCATRACSRSGSCRRRRSGSR